MPGHQIVIQTVRHAFELSTHAKQSSTPIQNRNDLAMKPGFYPHPATPQPPTHMQAAVHAAANPSRHESLGGGPMEGSSQPAAQVLRGPYLFSSILLHEYPGSAPLAQAVQPARSSHAPSAHPNASQAAQPRYNSWSGAQEVQ